MKSRGLVAGSRIKQRKGALKALKELVRDAEPKVRNFWKVRFQLLNSSAFVIGNFKVTVLLYSTNYE